MQEVTYYKVLLCYCPPFHITLFCISMQAHEASELSHVLSPRSSLQQNKLCSEFTERPSLLCQKLPHPTSLIFKKAVDHTCSRFHPWMWESQWREWHRMCYLLRSCDAAFLWQHSTRCYSHFAVFSFTASYSSRQSGSCKKGQQDWTQESEIGKEGRLKSLMLALIWFFYGYIFPFPFSCSQLSY